MREQSSSFDVARIVRELSELIGARARKAYQPHYEQVVVRLNRKGVPSTDLVIVRGRRIYTSQRDRPMPSKPSQFAMVLRKHLNNSRLIAVEQFGFDRVIELTFEHGGGRLKLVIELFREFIHEFSRARNPRRKMVLIDQLIHGFHGALESIGAEEQGVRRPAGVNLIEGNMHDVIRFLNDLTYGAGSTPELQESRKMWELGLKANPEG